MPCALTQFYDRTCLNEQIKMQQGLSRDEADEMIQQMTGIQYAAVRCTAHPLTYSAQIPLHPAGIH